MKSPLSGKICLTAVGTTIALLCILYIALALTPSNTFRI